MIRVLIYLLILAVLTYGGVLLVQNPGHVTLTWFGEAVDAPAALLIGAVAVAAIILWSVSRFIFGLPSFVKFAARQRRREKGYEALSRGLIAVGSGDSRTAGRAASQANRHLKNDPLAIMLRAQAAHMGGDGQVANSAFEELAQRDDTRVLGLRGLHAEATRRGDDEAARHFADAAHRAAPLPWSAQAVLGHRAADGDWEKALATVESALAARLIDKPAGERQRAVLETAIAFDKEMVDPEAALVRARAAIKRAPDLSPPVVLAARVLSRRGDIRKASKIIEKAWPRCQHPDIAQAYLDVRPGDSTQDRLTRAKTLMGIASFDPVSRATVAQAALANKDFETARNAMSPLIAEGKRPTMRQCLLMAELEENEYGDDGLWREWVARAARAPLDPAWVCDGIVYDHWAPASPSTGKLDAFQWQVPAERLGPAMEALPTPRRRQDATLPAPPPALEHHEIVPVAPQQAEPASPAPPAPAPAHTTPPRASVPDPAPVDAAGQAPASAASVVAPAETPKAPHEAPPETPKIQAHPPTAEVVAVEPPSHAVSAAAVPVVAPIREPQPAAAGAVAGGTTAAHEIGRDGPAPAAAHPDPDLPIRITLPPETTAAERNPSEPLTLFHRRLTADAEAHAERVAAARGANGAMPQDDDAPVHPLPRQTNVTPVTTPTARAAVPESPARDANAAMAGGPPIALGSNRARSAAPISSAPGPLALGAPAGPGPAPPPIDGSDAPSSRINLAPETVAEERHPVAPRSLFHRRMTAESEAQADRAAATRTGNGAIPPAPNRAGPSGRDGLADPFAPPGAPSRGV